MIPAGGAAQSRPDPEAPPASSVANTTGRRGAAIRTLGPLPPPPPGPLGVRLRPLPGLSTAVGGRSARRRLRAPRPFAPGSARAGRPARSHLPARACPGRGVAEAVGTERKTADQTLSAKGVRTLWELLPRGAGLTRGLKGGGGAGASGCPWASGLLRGRSRALVADSLVENRNATRPRFL